CRCSACSAARSAWCWGSGCCGRSTSRAIWIRTNDRVGAGDSLGQTPKLFVECRGVDRAERNRMGTGERGSSLPARCLAEVIGTFLLIFFGCGAVHAAVLAGAQSGLWQVAIVWGVAIAVAVYTVGGVSGAHINPAISVALALWGRFPWRLVPVYAASQFA